MQEINQEKVRLGLSLEPISLWKPNEGLCFVKQLLFGTGDKTLSIFFGLYTT